MVEIVVPVAFFAMIATIFVGTPIAKAYARRLDRQPAQLPNQTEMIARLERIEQSLEAVAMEVERIAEGQRFTTKLLSDARPTPFPSPLGLNAPHSAEPGSASPPPETK
jgi:hypothetical protein